MGREVRRFGVTIEPAEYCERLNGLLTSEDPADREQIELAKLFIDFCKLLPKAVFLPDGMLLAHGGFPHTDTHASLTKPVDLADPRCLNDFMWARLSDSPKKRPNRGNRGHEFGSRDFEQFCRVMSESVGVPVRRFVRGHDHIANRWQVSYSESVLTINAMGRRMEGETGTDDPPHPLPVIARYRTNSLPEVVTLPLISHLVDSAFGIPPRIRVSVLEEFPSAPYVDGPLIETPSPRAKSEGSQ